MLLNIDLGELAEEPDELYALAQLANIACGGHAGDAASIARAVAACRRYGTRVGAHPSYPDREGFGRRRLALSADELRRSVEAQCLALPEACYVKPHGALYHAADADLVVARAVVEGATAALGEVTMIGPAGGALQAASARFLREGFADRGMRDGKLIPRGQPGALIDDPAEAAAQAVALVGRVDTVCVHGDGANAVAVARAVRAALDGLP